jgi:hypothetical protein
MLTSLRIVSVLIAIAAALAAPAFAQQSTAKPNESPWAMRPPTPQAAATLTAQQLAAIKEAEKGTPAQQALARRVAEAMTNKDYAAIKDQIAPSTLKCIGKNQEFLQDRIRRQLALPMSRKFTLKVTPLPPNLMKATKYSTYPMPATHVMGIEFTTEDGRDATVNLPIGQEDGKWYEVQPCPTQEGLDRFAKLQQMRAKNLEHAKIAVANVKDPIKTQLLTLIGKHDNVAAWNLCMKSLHYDFPTCHGVVSLLAGQDTE